MPYLGHSDLVLRRKLVREDFPFLVLHRLGNLRSGAKARADCRKRKSQRTNSRPAKRQAYSR
jgi:hypothetical protein